MRARATLLTGLEPPEHGVRDNGAAGLPADVPTLATVLAERGYDTAAIVASRVLDRRFGLGRGFATYDDRMAAEDVGQYGYPERDARAVTDAGLAWLAERTVRPGPGDRPWFLWIHYYDRHEPYVAPASPPSAGDAERYAGEIAYVDEQLGRLFAALREPQSEVLIAVAGDHGESLGEHGETGHGLFLYEPSLRVPLLLAGPGVTPGSVVAEPVATKRLAATLLGLLGSSEAAATFGTPLPGIGLPAGRPSPAVYSEALLPATAYGWSASKAITDDRWRLIVAPRPELYDLEVDRGELVNRLAGGNPENVPFRAQLANARLATGDAAGAVEELTRALARNPRLDFLHVALARAQLALGEREAARLASDRALELNPRQAEAWLLLGEMAARSGAPEEERRLLARAVEAGTDSAVLLTRLGQLAAAGGDLGEADRHLAEAVRLEPGWAHAWLLWGDVAERRGLAGAALERYLAAVDGNPTNAVAALRAARLLAAAGDLARARELLAQAAAAAPESEAGVEARRRLAALDGSPSGFRRPFTARVGKRARRRHRRGPAASAPPPTPRRAPDAPPRDPPSRAPDAPARSALPRTRAR